MDLKMEVYTLPDLELLDTLEEFRALVYEEKAYAAGSFTLEAILNDRTRPLLREEHIIWFEGGSAGVIEYISSESGESGAYVTVKGRMLSGLLERRILWGQYDISGPPEQIMRRLVKDCAIQPTRGNTAARKLPNLELEDEPPVRELTVRKQKTGGSLLEALEELGEAYGVAFGVRFDPERLKLVFWARPGADLAAVADEPVLYSTELDDVLSASYACDTANSRNVALVAGEGEGAARVYTVVGDDGAASETARFIPSGSTEALRTADGKSMAARTASATSGDTYISQYTGPQIDEAVGKALSGGGGGTTSGVTSFNGRTGAVNPQTGDYTAQMVGAATMEQVTAAIQAAVLDSWEAVY